MTTRRSAWHLVLFAFATANTAAHAQAADWNPVKALTPGTQVRISADSRTLNGTIDRVTDQSLAVTSGSSQQTFDRQHVSVIWVKRGGHRKRNALIGLAAGTGAGLGIGLAARSRSGQLQIVSNTAVAAAFTVAGALAGTVIGVVIPTGGWHEIYRK
jgi:hypothetical protein